MKNLLTLLFALFFATTAAAESYEPSGKITQTVLAGELSQTVYAGDNIAPIKISYTITEGKEGEIKGHQSYGLSDLGLTESWEGSICEISGQIGRNLVAQTISAYILVQDDEGKSALTELSFEITEKPFSFTWDSESGDMNQSVKVGETITPIVFDYDGIKTWGVSELPAELIKENDLEKHTITIAGTIDEGVAAGDYKYQVVVTDENDEKHTLSGTITVEGLTDVTDIHIVENEKQTAVAGAAIKPVVLTVTNATTVRIEDAPPGNFEGTSANGITLTINGTVDKTAKDSTYVMKVIAEGNKNNDTAFATIEVVHKPVETSSSSTLASSSSAAPGSSSEKASEPKSSNSSDEKPSSSSAKSDKNPSNEKGDKGDKTDKIATVAMNGAKFGYANNMLTVALPTSSMVRVQVFDLTGHLVESLVEPVSGSRNFSLAHLNRGNYLARIESGSQTHAVKIAVK